MNPTLIIGILVLTVAVTGTIGLVTYSALTPWWSSRAGRAYFSLFGSLVTLAWHFVFEGVFGQSPPWVEIIVISLVQAAILFNIFTAAKKQLLGYRKRQATK